VRVTEASQVGEARRAAIALAGAIGFDEDGRARAALIVTEAANNLAKHAREGEVLLRALEQGSAVGLEVLALDKGPGMADVRRCMRDGFSTAGSPGTGLGAIARQSSSWGIYSTLEKGTALVARLWNGPPPVAGGFLTAVVSLPKGGEEICGDTWAVARDGGRELLLVVDGLGHGPLAAEASLTAARIFRENLHSSPVSILQSAHAALRGTRGGAAAVAEIDLDRHVVQYAGVGNIAGTVLSGEGSRSLISYNGTVGHEARSFQTLSYPFPRGAILVMHSDGLGSRWSLEGYPGLASFDLALIAGVLYRDFQRGRDDVTVLAARAEDPA
jgi:anti-sigma regulatory factor (Ser/Thr protein kinase)